MSTLIKTVLSLSFLFIGLSSRGQLPTANFTAAKVSGCSPMIVDFQDLSTGNPNSWTWDFGNGATSNFQNPSTTYFNPGVYTVTLTVKNAAGTNTLVRTSYITVYSKPTVNFSVSDSDGCFPVYSQFINQSTASAGTTNNSFFWDFGDGVQSNLANPSHSYTTAGNFSVTLKVTNDKGCWSVLSKPAYIKITNGVKTNFSNTTPNACTPPFPISFTNASTGPGSLSYLWNFGDGNTSTQPNPTHNYNNPGTYTVSLITTSTQGCSDTLTKNNLYTILDINSSFTAPDSVCIDEVVNLQSNTTPAPSSMLWEFGDGTTSNIPGPNKSWSIPGTYTIRLINHYPYCSDSINKQVVVSSRPVANFTTTDTFKCQPSYTVNFQNQSQAAVSWLWDFGDGNTSTAANPSHTYTSYGSFTVQLIAFNSAGCPDTLIKNNYIKIIKPVITIPSLPQEGCVPITINFVANVNTQDNVTSYLWDFGDGTTSTLPTPSHTYPIQGTYDVSVTITTSTGCTETLLINGAVKVGRRPIIDFTAAPNPVCAFTDVQFTNLSNEGEAWIWNFGDGMTSVQPNPTHEYTDTGWFHVSLVVFNNGCRDSLRKLNYIQIKPPIAKFGFVPDCSNRLLFNFRDSSIGALTWLWNFGDGNTSTAQNPTHIYSNFGTYDVTLTVTNDTCSNTMTKTIKVFNESPNFVAGQTSACRTGNISFNATNITVANIVSYVWDFGNGTGITSQSPNVTGTYPLSGYYTVKLITTDIYGCMDTVEKINYIRINGPTASFTATNTAGCIGLTTTFNDLSTDDGISNIVNWKFDFGDGSVQSFTGAPFQHTYNTPGTFSVKLIVTDAGGCKDSLTLNSIVNASDPVANFISADTLACPGSTVVFQNTSAGYAYTSFWKFGDGDTVTQHAPSHIYTNPGLYSVSLLITDFYGCSDSITKVNYIKVESPVASYNISDSISSCIPFEVNFFNTSQYSIQAIWNLGTGISTQTDPTVFYVTPGVYNTSLTITSPGGCKDSAFRTITVYDTVGTYLQYQPLGGCKPLLVNLQSFSPGPMRYTWDFGDGSLLNTDSSSLSHVYNLFGNFVPKIIMTDPSGCVIPVTGPDTIRVIGAIAKFGLDSAFFCDRGMVNFLDSTTYNDSIATYTWDFGDGTTSNTNPPSHYYTSPGFYTVSLTVQTQNACVDTFRLQNVVKIVESPSVIIGGDSVICVNELMTHLGVFEKPDTSLVKWSWTFPNGNIAQIQNPAQQRYPVAGNFSVTTIATNSSGCRDTSTKNILVNPLPVVTMPETIYKQAGFPVTIPAIYTSNVANYDWTPEETLSCSDCPQPVANPKFNTRYTVSFVDSNGCRNSGQIQVIVFCENANVFVPNTFSPNGDGSNDVFYVRGKGLERVKTLRIFNRWGEVVFEKNNFSVNDASVGWDGRYKGNQAVPDVYVYQVEVFCENSDIIKFEGNVALIR